MTRWARLTWQAAEPAELATALATRLGLLDPADGDVPGASALDLGSALLEVRPWAREGPADTPTAGGRLMLEPVPGGEEAPGSTASAPLVLAGIGWATVELDRADEELGPWLGDRLAHAGEVEPHLGAVARVRAAGGMPGEAFVLLEPSTEGRLAASLARDGEGPCALYLRPTEGLRAWSAAARRRGVRLGRARQGPLGASRLVLGGPPAGPHLLLVDARAPSNRIPGTGTIAP